MEDNSVQVSGISQRPKFGGELKSIGQSVKVTTNMFKIEYKGSQKIYNYLIHFEPAVPADSRQLKFDLISLAKRTNEFKEAFGEKSIFSGDNLYAFKLHDKAFRIKVGEGVQEHTVLLELTNTISMQDLTPMANKTSNITTMVLNMMIKQSMRTLGMREMGRNKKYYDSNEIFKNEVNFQSKHPIFVWSGFKTSVSLGQSGQYLQIDFCSRVIKKKTLLDFIYDFKTDEEADRELAGKTVIADYGNSRSYRVDGIESKMRVTDKFDSNGKPTTYVDYYKTKYKINIKDLKQPLARVLENAGRDDERKIYLVPELLITTGITDEERSNFKMMQALAEYTKLTAQARQDTINKMASRIEKTSQDFQLNPKSNQVDAVQLYEPKITLGKTTQAIQGGNFQIRNVIESPSDLKDWVIIYCSNGKRDDDDIDFLLEDFNKIASGFGIRLGKPGFLTVNNDRQAKAWIDALDKDIKKNGKPQLVLSITMRKNKQIYEEIKNYLNCEQGVVSQHMCLQGGIQKNRLSVISKILLQINAKLGQPLWLVEKPKNIPATTMLIGIEFSRFNEKGKSKTTIGVVATLNAEFNKLWSKAVIILDGGQGHNVLNSIQAIIQKAIKAFQKANQKLPTHIVLYRESSGDSASEQIAKIEINGIQKAFEEVSAQYKPEFAYIIFKKKINNRFFLGTDKNLQNPNPGTLIYKDVSGQHFNFYLIPQKVTQGCATPTEFIVCYNTTSLTQEIFFQLTYNQCYSYFNWSGAVRVPAVAQYARKLAYMIGDTMKKEFHPDLTDGPIYL